MPSLEASPVETIGWREWVALPELGIPAVKAKVDTGARTSALHTFELEAFEEEGILKVRFSLHPLRKRPDVVLRCVAEVTDRRIVSDSGGHREHRYFITTPISLGGHTWPIELSLTHRETMMFRMLLGRTAMTQTPHLLVNPRASYLTGRTLAQAYPPTASDTL